MVSPIRPMAAAVGNRYGLAMRIPMSGIAIYIFLTSEKDGLLARPMAASIILLMAASHGRICLCQRKEQRLPTFTSFVRQRAGLLPRKLVEIRKVYFTQKMVVKLGV